jgi:predicted transposase/invertase (TIGR01784 family)
MLLKSAFEEFFPDLLRFYYPSADKVFDIKKGFEFLDKELAELFPEPQKQGGGRFVDMLVKTYLKTGKEEWILVHIEIQRANDKNFAHRMLQYWYRIYDRYRVDITALVVFTGSKQQKRPFRFRKSFMGTEIIYEYNIYHILDHTEQELLAMDNPFALIVLAAQKALLMNKIPEEELARHRLTVARALIQSKKYNHEQITRFLFFLKNFIHIESSGINRNFDKQLNKLTGKKETMGIIETIKQITFEEGMEKGLEKSKEQFVKNLLSNTDFSIAKIALLANVTEAFVKKVKAGSKL